uniref:Apoptotic chromatin condensation inducer in the nucleus n=2 Tax=Anthurium amnicola TaxID=1678845 RepID=A0A1D1XQ91_9ARAE
MVQPSSSDVVPVAGDFNPLDNDQEPEDNRGSVEEIEDVANTSSVELTKEIVNSNGGSPEKLNLDRSSGDESMEEDVLDTKHIESNNNPDVVGDTREVRELHVVKEGAPLDAVMGGFPADKDIVTEENIASVLAEKRKLEDQGSLGITEPVKRQRRWNAETIKVPEPQTSNQTSMTPKDIFLSTPRRIFTRTDSGLSGDSPKERFVPPSPKAATTSLRIDRFLRPFTLKAVQELLAKTGTVCSFWMDHIKTHCYVTYSSVEEAIATRNVLYNLQWPPNGGRLLTADFVDPQEVKMHVEAPESPAPVGPSTVAPSAPSIERPNASQPPLQSNRQQLPPPPLLPQPPPVLQPPPARECERLAPPPPPKKPEPPILTLDDLFKKTRATPRIYYLPLSEEQVAARLGAQGRSSRV